MTRQLRAPGHAADIHSEDGEATGTCRCGAWSETAATQDDVRDSYRAHVAEARGLRWDDDAEDWVPIEDALPSWTAEVSGPDHDREEFTVKADSEELAVEVLRAAAASAWSVEAANLTVLGRPKSD